MISSFLLLSLFLLIWVVTTATTTPATTTPITDARVIIPLVEVKKAFSPEGL